MTEHQMTLTLVCVTCKRPILETDDWSWLDGRRRVPEHDACYALRFARQYPLAAKVPRGDDD